MQEVCCSKYIYASPNAKVIFLVVEDRKDPQKKQTNKPKIRVRKANDDDVKKRSSAAVTVLDVINS